MKSLTRLLTAAPLLFLGAFAPSLRAATPAAAVTPNSVPTANAPAFTSQVTGHGRPMLLIPGLGCPGAVWDTTVAHFKNTHECHVLSLAGFAGTPARVRSANEPFLDSTREAIATYIRDRKLDRPIVVGHSLGGYLALDLGARHPALVGPLVIVDSIPFISAVMRPDTTPAQAKANAAAMRQQFAGIDAAGHEQFIRSGASTRQMVLSDDDHNRIVTWSLASDRTTVMDAMTELFSADLRGDLSRIKSPTVVFAAWIGYKPYTDRARTEATFRAQFATLSGVKLVVSDTARHFIMFDDPSWLFAQMESFLAAQPPSSAAAK